MPASWNVTQSSLNASVGSSFDMGLILMIAICVAGAIGLLLVLSSIERYTRLFNLIDKWVTSLKYTAFGIGMSAVGYGLYLICKTITTVGSGIDPIWIVEAIAVYVGLTVLGWGGSKIAGRIKTLHSAYVAAKPNVHTEVVPTEQIVNP